MRYKEQVLESHATALHRQSFMVVVGYTFMFLFAFSLLHSFTNSLHHLEEVLSLGRMRYGLQQQQEAFRNGLLWWGGTGFIVGLFKGNKYKVESQKIMCMVEQERHLRRIASGDGRSLG